MKLAKVKSTSQTPVMKRTWIVAFHQIARGGQTGQVPDGVDRPGVHDGDEGGIVEGGDEHHQQGSRAKEATFAGHICQFGTRCGGSVCRQFFFFVFAAHTVPPFVETILVWIAAIF
jgi:hypothetical protein